jgi:hypothetical protein
MNDPVPLHRHLVPDSHWLAEMTAPVAADALSYLLAAASEMLDWFDDEGAARVQSIIELASELVVTVTEGAENRPPVSFPVWLTAQVADHIADAAERFEVLKTYDVCTDQYNEAAIVLVNAMRQTAQDLRKAARPA